jgi:hypothetical protein
MWEGDPAVAACHPHATSWQSAFPPDYLAARAAHGDRLAAALTPTLASWHGLHATLDKAPAYHMLFTLPSFINHSATTNTAIVLVGSTMFVRASRKLKAGEELFVNYFDVAMPFAQRRKAEEALGFQDRGRRGVVEGRPGVAELHEEMHAIYEALSDGCLNQEVRSLRCAPP